MTRMASKLLQWACCGAAALAGAGAWAQGMSTEQAVQTLLGKALPATAANAWPPTEQGTGRITPAMPATRMNDDSRATMVVPRGATLAALLAPVLRQVQAPKNTVFSAFVALNPQAFVRGNPNRLMAGATVRMFSDADIAQLNNGQSPTMAHGQTSREDRRNWVRFP